MAFFDFLFGKSETVKEVPRFDPQQMEIFQQMMGGQGGLGQQPLFQQGSDFLQSLFGGDLSAFEAPIMRQFQQQTGDIASRFGGAGAGSSSALNQALARASENLGETLGAQRAGLMMQSLPQALNFAGAPFQQQRDLLNLQPFDRYVSPSTPGALGQTAGGIGELLQSGLGGPLGQFLQGRTSSFLGV